MQFEYNWNCFYQKDCSQLGYHIAFSTVSYCCSSNNFPTCGLATVGSALQDKMKNSDRAKVVATTVVHNLGKFNAANIAVFSAGAIYCFECSFYSNITQTIVFSAYI